MAKPDTNPTDPDLLEKPRPATGVVRLNRKPLAIVVGGLLLVLAGLGIGVYSKGQGRSAKGAEDTSALDADRAAQQIVAGRIYNSAIMLFDNIGNQNTVGSYITDSGLFIISHESAVSYDISTKDCCELAFKTFLGQ